ncbi:hypothetical protein Nos7524_5431 [Nostoc sp. PCC 7524]|uniref:DUF4383 domain-containing protein n=1 Tax=Nostoc sp. (strain ATCC 29411 / PCC 7524) TaxID=28072 RepID=UPI00029F4D96|nr:DUF4383 domain-containing protein [Nostoc sp. PCC 7524]AFY51148.1 hypothetical protein Nos7524_5431 [Nostoc sp. PCC 7524]
MENISAARTTERYCALIIGVVFLLLGLAGFTPALVSLPGTSESYIPADVAPNAYAAGFGYIFGLFPTNFLHNLVRCAVGLWGITSYTSASSSRIFNRAFAVAYLVLAIMGLLPFAKTFFGFMPLFGNNVLINALSAIAAAYYGIVMPAKVAGVNVSQNL